MCGIIGYIGEGRALDCVIKGLERLEYRGYDSAGVAFLEGSNLCVKKTAGRVATLKGLLTEKDFQSKTGIGHTRWATHGAPSDLNAHPHTSRDGRFALVHNGIIENYVALRTQLVEEGYVFVSETDTEVLVHLIDRIQKAADLDFVEAVRQALTQIEGAYGIAIVNRDTPDQLIAARKGSPLVLGVGVGENFIASDSSPLVEYTRQVVYLNDGELAVVRASGYDVMSIDGAPVATEVHELEWSLEAIEKSGYEHFTLKEIMEQPDVLRNAMRGRIDRISGLVKLGGVEDVLPKLIDAQRIVICASGTSWHAGLIGEYLLEKYARIPVEVEYASEFRYREPILNKGDVVLVISQSGETADTLAAVREAQGQGVLVLGICNVVGSSIARETDAGVYLHVGPEIGVASTKAFTAQVTVLSLLSLLLAQKRGVMSEEEVGRYTQELATIPEKITQILQLNEQIKGIAREYRLAQNCLYLGRGFNFPVALEGALKLKELSYIHAEGCPAAEMKHGPIALIDQFMPVIFIAPKDAIYDKVVSNMEEVAARGGSLIAITNEGNHDLDTICQHVVHVPQTLEGFEPLLTVIPLQLLSYHMAVMRGCDVDKPRNLAKSVTVE